MDQKKASSDLNLCVVTFSDFSYAFDCIPVILYILIVNLHFL